MKNVFIIITMLISLSLFSQFPSPDAPPRPTPTPTASNVDNNFKSVSVEGITLSVPDSWVKNPGKNLWTNGKGNSVNIISEAAPGYTLKAYVDLSIKNMKKMIKTYKVISKGEGKGKNVTYMYYLGTYSLTEVGAASGSINIYSLFVDAKDTKYVITIGSLPQNFKEMDSTLKKIMKTISLNTSYKKVVDNKGGIKVIGNKVSVDVPNGWAKTQGRDMWIDPLTRSSINVIVENATGYTLDSYLDLSLKNMKKMIPSYKLTEKTKRKVAGRELGILLGEFTINNVEIKLYSVVMNLDGVKYVLSVGGPKKSFKSLSKTFNKIINSFKKL